MEYMIKTLVHNFKFQLDTSLLPSAPSEQHGFWTWSMPSERDEKQTWNRLSLRKNQNLRSSV